MQPQDMINAITSSIQTESNLILLLTTQITSSLSSMSSDQLQAICTILGIDTSGN